LWFQTIEGGVDVPPGVDGVWSRSREHGILPSMEKVRAIIRKTLKRGNGVA
jgi:hypothetical protein